MAGHAAALKASDERIAWVLADPGTSFRLQAALEGAQGPGPLEVLNDLEILDHLLRA
jgi:hypothetical protein